MKIYEGDKEGVTVMDTNTRRRVPLAPRWDLRNHSPTGFAWGYHGSGPAQLALAILADCVGDEKALNWYQRFKSRAIANLKKDEAWTLSESQVREVLAVLESEQEGA